MEMSNNFKQVKLSTIARDTRNLFEPKENSQQPYIGLEHIEKETLTINGIGKSDETISTKKIFNKDNILFGTLRPYFKKLFLTNFSGVCSTDIAVIEPVNGTDLNYLFYFMANNDFIDKANNYSNGARMPRVNWNTFSSTEWLVPDITIQEKIGSLLRNYDLLIENNNKRIQILEKMAQTLYNEWFVNFRFPGHEKVKMVDSELGKIPEGWKIDSFDNHLTIKNGFAFKSSDYTNNGYKLIRTQDFSTTKYIKINDEVCIPESLIDKYQGYLLKEWDFLLIMVGASIGRFGVVIRKDLPALQNQNMWAMRPKLNSPLDSFFVLGMMHEIIYKVTNYATGAARSFFRKGYFQNQKIFIPTDSVLEQYSSIITPIWNEIEVLIEKQEKLEKTRDILIPKLISGEIDVSEIDI